jgi:hypothetical protein
VLKALLSISLLADRYQVGDVVRMPGKKSSQPGPALMRGSLIVLRRRCGKANCRCADGESLHEAPALSYSVRGRTQMLPASAVAEVAEATARYRAAVTELEAAGDAAREALAARLAADKASRGTRRGR